MLRSVSFLFSYLFLNAVVEMKNMKMVNKKYVDLKILLGYIRIRNIFKYCTLQIHWIEKYGKQKQRELGKVYRWIV